MTLGDLAWNTNSRKLAVLSYKHDLQNSSNLINLIEILKVDSPKQALLYSIYGWKQFHLPLFLLNNLYLVSASNDIHSLKQFFLDLTPADIKLINNREIYWQSLARIYQVAGMPTLEALILQQGIAASPHFKQLKADLLWLIMRCGDLLSLKKYMQTWYEQGLLHTNILWQVFAEGFGVLNKFDQGLALYEAHLPTEPENYQAIIDYANMLEKAQKLRDAFIVRYLLWEKLQTSLNCNSVKEKQPCYVKRWPNKQEEQTLQILSQLAPYFQSGTIQLHYMGKMLRLFPDDQSITIIINWLMQNNYYNLVNLFAKYYLAKPLDNRIAIFLALTNNDLPTLQKVITDHNTLWPRADHINAALSLENSALATDLAFKELTERPSADEIYSGFSKTALADANFARVTTEDQLFIDVFGPSVKLETKYRLTNELSVEPYLSSWFLHSNNPNSITNVPSQDLQTGLILNQKIWRGSLQYMLGYRQVVGSFPTASIDLNYQLSARWHVNLSAGLNQAVYQTSYLLVGGVQDKISANFLYNYAKYDSLHFDLQGQNYYSQNRHYLGNGYFAQALYKHKFWLTYPDFTFDFYANIWDFNHNGSFGGDITTLFPKNTLQQNLTSQELAYLNYNLILPPTYRQIGVIFNFGDPIIEYSHAWRPYCWVDYFYNTYVGFAYLVRAGINGSVFGRDALSFYAERGIAPAVQNSVTQKVGLRYSLYY